MKITIEPSHARGTIQAPPSKSISHRLLICAGLARGRSVIRHVAPSEDVLATLDCLEAIGARCTYEAGTVTVEGAAIPTAQTSFFLPCRESGSTLRFFLPICAGLQRPTVCTGSSRLLARPLGCYETIFREQNLRYENTGSEIHLSGALQPGKFRLKGNISSQFISGLLFALPLLPGDSTIHILPPIESKAYIDLTVEALAQFGVTVRWTDERTLAVPGGQHYAPREVFVEGDYSNAAFFEALNVLGGAVRVEGLREESIQGDKAYRAFFPMLQRGTPTIHLGGCPDLGPILFALAAALNGAIFTGTRRLRLKESDRAAAMGAELRKLGAAVKIEEDSVLVYPAAFHAPREPLQGHNDHRIVMALSVLLTKLGGTLEGAEAVRKSMPDFFEALEALGVTVRRERTQEESTQ